MNIPGFNANESLYQTKNTYSSQPLNQIGEIVPQLGCSWCCLGKKGFGACVVRCQIDGKCCDNGRTNCE